MVAGRARYSSAVATQLERRTGTQQAIIDAALALYLEQSTIEASIDAIAERAGVAKSTVLYHFRSRLGLLDAIADRLFREMGGRLGPLDRYEGPADFVRAFLREGMAPEVRIYFQVGDQLQYARGSGKALRSLVGGLESLGVTERTLVIAAAAMTMAREVTFGHADELTIDAFVDELFADS